MEPTPDGHHVVVDGRKWQATDPLIPDRLRKELVAELMAARRAVGQAQRDDDTGRERSARRRVSDAKHALGERGRPWWEPPEDDAETRRTRAAVRALLRHRASDSSICPSEVARVVRFDAWRERLPAVRRSVERLMAERAVILSRGGEAVDTFDGGPVRIRRGTDFPDPP